MKTLTEMIMASSSPWDNPYQGRDKKVLFVCSAGILRSATAARIYAHKHNTRAAGSEDYALVKLTPDLLLWADEIVFVNDYNYQGAKTKFNLDELGEKVKVLNIPDDYEHMHPELIAQFKKQYENF